jgi:Na+-translocating ferredoxin:NAD+ oxidoreductase subunit B
MTDIQNEYELLARALDELPNGFPRTQSNIEIALLQKLFSPEEARIAGMLSGRLEPVEQIASRIGLPPKESQRKLLELAKRGLIWFEKTEGKLLFRLAPFVIGIYESQRELMDPEFAHLFEHYMQDGGAKGIMKYQPALTRVVPSAGSVKSEWILPYDDIKAIIAANKRFWAGDCICRIQQANLNKRCHFPVGLCLSMSPDDSSTRPGNITQDEALDMLDLAEELGMVHSVSNMQEGLSFICNCCGCCCAILRGITDWGLDKSVVQANYFAEIDRDSCSGCATCVNRCQTKAISLEDNIAIINKSLCIGCGLCVSSCPTESARLMRKPDSEIIPPPVNFADWESQRLQNRKP